jgi:riboflavin kinase / FMN adenylyltransferase
MKIFHDLPNYSQADNKIIATIGSFDGVHKGHREILNQVIAEARKSNGSALLITFWPHPKLVLYPDDNNLRLINTMDEKQELLENAGIDILLKIPFSKEFAALSKHEFINILVQKIGINKLIIGYDHRFGRNREGSYKDLVKAASDYDFEVKEIPGQMVKNVTVSSTSIREALYAGNIKLANSYLGYPFFITGKVVEGSKMGRQLTFPTANLHIPEKYKLIPAHGVYAAYAGYEGKLYPAMANIGVRPTFDEKTTTIETHLFDFNGDMYGKQVRLFLMDKMRPEMRFSGSEELQKQLNRDRELAQKILSEIPRPKDNLIKSL